MRGCASLRGAIGWFTWEVEFYLVDASRQVKSWMETRAFTFIHPPRAAVSFTKLNRAISDFNLGYD